MGTINVLSLHYLGTIILRRRHHHQSMIKNAFLSVKIIYNHAFISPAIHKVWRWKALLAHSSYLKRSVVTCFCNILFIVCVFCPILDGGVNINAIPHKLSVGQNNRQTGRTLWFRALQSRLKNKFKPLLLAFTWRLCSVCVGVYVLDQVCLS